MEHSIASQLDSLNNLLARLGRGESYYRPVLDAVFRTGRGGSPAVASLQEFFAACPFTTKEDLLRDREEHPPFGSNLPEPIARYTRLCQTSGTATGQAMPVLDTPESWESMLGTWREVFRNAGLVAGRDRIFFAFGFGPFLGFWTAFEAAATDYLSLPGGGMDSRARLAQMAQLGATVLCSTPTYAARLGQLIGQAGYPGAHELAVKTLIVAGEPGGSVSAIRTRISSLWGGGRVFDHHGMTEVGPVSWEHPHSPGILCLDHQRFLCEVVDPQTGSEVEEGHEGELVLTTLARTASPLLRYRTRDRVRKLLIDGVLHLDRGILGRADDMVIVRGVNLYPSAVEEVIRSFPEVDEFRVVQREVKAMAELELEVETTDSSLAPEIEQALRNRFSLRIPVTAVAPGSLPCHEFKAKRWTRAEA